MDQQKVRDQHTPPNLQTNHDQMTTFNHQNSTTEMQSTPDKHKTVEQQTTLAQEPKSDQSDQDFFPDQQITPEGNEAFLRQHQRHLRTAYPSCDLSEVSYHTEHTDFPGSRHSSLNTEPLTLDADQIHDAKDQAVDVMQQVDTDAAFDIFTKDLQVKTDEPLSQESEAQALSDQLNTLVEKAQQVVEANEQQQAPSMNLIAGAPSHSSVGEMKRPEDSTTSLEDEVKLKND